MINCGCPQCIKAARTLEDNLAWEEFYTEFPPKIDHEEKRIIDYAIRRSLRDD
jgi:glutaredoxin